MVNTFGEYIAFRAGEFVADIVIVTILGEVGYTGYCKIKSVAKLHALTERSASVIWDNLSENLDCLNN